MEPGRGIREKWKLTQQAFDKLLAALAFDRNEAGEKYLNLRKNLIRFFEARQVSTAEDAADEVINRLARKLENGEEFENINTYALGVARIVSLEISKSPDRKTSNELPEIGVSPFDKDTEEREEKLNCLEKCLRELSAENCQIIIGYYRGERREKIENRQKLADDLGIPNNALRSRAVRLRDKLEICITDCLKKQKFL
jgi:DNA-directed RNA polymerase specialized sigma24 family protein